MVWEDLRPSHSMTRQSIENAITACMALGGSTNAMVHLVAIAGRLSVDLPQISGDYGSDFHNRVLLFDWQPY